MNKIKFAVVGVGGIGRSHIAGIAKVESAVLTAVCDIDEAVAKQIAEENGLEKYYTDFDTLLVSEDVDAVVVGTPDQSHCEYTVKSLKAGKHVMCEKPMAMTIEECKLMIAAARETDKQLMIGQVCRKAPGFVKAKELIEAGEIGELFYVESEYAHDYCRIPGKGGWRIDPVRLRHPIIGGGCHAIDLLRWIAGNPSEVFAYANRKMLTTWPVDDCTIAVMKFPNDVIGKVFTSIGCKRTYTMRTVLYGSKGTIITDNTSPEITLQREVDAHIEVTMVPVDINNHNIAAEIEELCEAILMNTDVLTDGVQGASTVAVGCAIVESAATGEKVIIDYKF
ncbi:MAG: Gfo/Idh/MocA family oxidoreductase [Oscillospiraceae bacterium]|nr:Gfo/Idh/MocA family oxidoreductase [Oscillospiraceae bacterium]